MHSSRMFLLTTYIDVVIIENAIMFSNASVCLFVNRITEKTINQIFMKLHGMIGYSSGTNRLDCE